MPNVRSDLLRDQQPQPVKGEHALAQLLELRLLQVFHDAAVPHHDDLDQPFAAVLQIAKDAEANQL